MKLNRALLVAAVLVGSVAMVGCNRADDENDAQLAPTEQASVSGDQVASTASGEAGVEHYARGGWGRGGRGGWGRGGWGRGGRWDG